jgi:hypothetical protein
MALMKQTITLEIVYDDHTLLYRPDEWAWEVLIGLGPNESVEIISSTTPERVDN